MSNALKFTFEGQIVVTLQRAGDAIQLKVRDTGTGVSAEEMPRLFERFHRIENARGRTHEGSGIGLAMVHELVKLHGGSIAAESEFGKGTTFTVAVPLGSAHLPSDQIETGSSPTSTGTAAMPYVKEALRWLPDEDQRSNLPGYQESLPVPHLFSGNNGDDRPRVLVADDNADMRQYVVRLLAEHYRTAAVPDGEAALAAATAEPPDLILTDVMMPRLDGFGLLRALRADPRTRAVPVIMLSARAGEESRVEGMEAGADDYLVKPFSARELLARVTAHLQMAQMRREASEALQQSHARFAALFDAAPIGVYLVDANMRIRQVNPKARPVFGDIEGLIGGDFVKIIHVLWPQKYGEEVVERFRHTLETGEPYFSQERIEERRDRKLVEYYEWQLHRLTLPDGQYGVVCYFSDISRHVLAQQALAEANRFLNLSLDALSSHIAVLDENGIILAVNDAWRRFADENQYTAHDYGVGSSYLEESEPSSGGSVESGIVTAGLNDVLQGRMTHFELEYPCHSPTEERWFVMRVTRFKSPGPVRVVVSHENVTTRRKAEETLKDADRRKNEFLAMLAHELRNPLAPIRNMLEIMKHADINADLIEQARNTMDRQLGQMTRLIDDLLDVSRISQGKLNLRTEKVELASVVQQVVEACRPAMESANHELTVTLPPQAVYLSADPARLAQVFGNLLGNAAKYTEPGGQISLAAEQQGSDVVISVKDTGIGISPEMLPKIFELFTQVDSSLEKAHGGLGIGLTLVQKLVEMHGGSVQAFSEGLGRGSEVVVRLPVMIEKPKWQPPQLPLAVPTPGRARRILVVDDNRDSAISLALLLKIVGNETYTAYDGLKAVEAAAKFKPDVVLLDIGLPKLNGYDACRKIREQPWGKGMVLIALTGWGQEEARQKSKDAGFDDHLVKPLDYAALTNLLDELEPVQK